MALSMLVDQAELDDHGVILAYVLGNTSRRLDATLDSSGMSFPNGLPTLASLPDGTTSLCTSRAGP
jgi:hypothetical protein